VWVRTLKTKPKGCITNAEGFIVECPKFVEFKKEQSKDE